MRLFYPRGFMQWWWASKLSYKWLDQNVFLFFRDMAELSAVRVVVKERRWCFNFFKPSSGSCRVISTTILLTCFSNDSLHFFIKPWKTRPPDGKEFSVSFFFFYDFLRSFKRMMSSHPLFSSSSLSLSDRWSTPNTSLCLLTWWNK